jgi:hypothetical protein
MRLVARLWLRELLHDLFDREAAGLLPRRELSERRQVLGDYPLRGNHDKQVLDKSLVVLSDLLLPALEWIGTQGEQLRRPQPDERLHPNFETVR